MISFSRSQIRDLEIFVNQSCKKLTIPKRWLKYGKKNIRLKKYLKINKNTLPVSLKCSITWRNQMETTFRDRIRIGSVINLKQEEIKSFFENAVNGSFMVKKCFERK